ncbi:hypothetical protein [Xanthocytophaga flava]|uniref:hypothetical protein n=1 Tax=Xanthocytophaga flava TaxID=3048013 RepID=UPI0028D64C02|nr:hypothetical protein [Xanthocytophaga flavus]MDJ1470928.1 hypothetical protein [Xanthocytophaga flavus]
MKLLGYLPFFFFITALTVIQAQQAPLDSIAEPVNEKAEIKDAPRVYIDCKSCDMSFIRQEISFVSHVRDRQLAEVQVFITDQVNGSGGRTYVLAFTGKGVYEGINNKLTFHTIQSQTGNEIRTGLKRIIQLGLASYAAHTALADQINLSFKPDTTMQRKVPVDRWNNWVMEVYGGGSFNKESQQSSLNVYYGLRADRVTEEWRIRNSLSFSINNRRFLSDSTWIHSEMHRNTYSGSIVKSINDHWSGGVFVGVTSSTYDNIALNCGIAPAIEYSFLPYREAMRKEITLVYRIGYSHRNYFETTLYEKNKETVYSQVLEAAVRIMQPWGSVSVQVMGTNFLHDFKKNRLTFDGGISMRVVKGLSVSFNGRLNIVHDQINLPKGDASLEDILLQQRTLATSFQLYNSIGVSYTFGSIYNNVVNLRL